ncbi:hypothetical protein PDJ82_22790 [Bacillus cereus group sp. TH43LC]|uniref:Uncharacterized protein n=4 Tax=Bacillus TaxID=1386 RepID=B9IS60_BACCQ|nr:MULTISPECIES: hypothetical protein [Bacillus]ACM11422.1 hypothetical protein BCQ_0992 [Bacillus cereus Q1]EJQ10833.1 hypothetical protein IC5_00078 [Bacillus cereus AND1407]KFL80736.1 hypothetical protein DJ51_1760 [Bacillus cereus]MRA62621.1 hypothetical protein [Bacillus thuringiensis]OUB96343.1 hypothetical protein BK752_16400 [Bacillus thuringiensis serovar canadensis]
MSTQSSVQMDEMLKILFHLSRKPTIHLVNGLFHEAFELHDQLTITHLNVEYTQKRLTNSYQTKRSDKVLQVKNNDDVFHYHLEFQLKNDSTMPYRMFDYGCCIAEECQKSIGTYDKFVFPRQLVLFIEEDEKIPDFLSMELHFTSGGFHYQVPVEKYWKQDVNQLMKRNLYALLPIQPFNYRKNLNKILDRKPSKNRDEEIRAILDKIQDEVKILVEIIIGYYNRDELTFDDTDKMLIVLTNVTEHVFQKNSEYHIIKKEVDNMINTLWSPVKERKVRVEAFKELIYDVLQDKNLDTQNEELRTKLNKIDDPNQMKQLARRVHNVKKIDDLFSK